MCNCSSSHNLYKPNKKVRFEVILRKGLGLVCSFSQKIMTCLNCLFMLHVYGNLEGFMPLDLLAARNDGVLVPESL